MKNKKIIIAIVIILILVAAAVAGVLILKPFDKKDDDKDEKTNTAKVEEKNDEKKEEDVDYEAILEKFLAACDSEDDMNDFVDEYVDIKSLYVINLVDSPSKFMDEYQKTKSKDYKDYADDVKEQFADFVDSEEEIKLLDVEDPKDMSEIGIDIWKDVRFTVEIDDEEYELAAVFCEDKIVTIATTDTIEAMYDLEDDSSTESDDTLSKKEMTAKGTANDALSTALSSISTDFYTNLDIDDGSLTEMLTVEKLSELAPGYEYTIESSEKNGSERFTITMENDDYTFVAEVTDTLTISSFELEK